MEDPTGQAGAGDWWAVDLHGDILMDVARRRAAGERRVLLTRHLPALRAGRVRLQVLPIFVESEFLPDRGLNRALEMVAALYRELDESRETFLLVKSRVDLRLVERGERIGLLLAFEGAEALESDPTNLLRLFYELGVRLMSLTWNRPTRFAAGAGGGEGLTRDGVALIRAMNELGIVLDVSHLHDSAFEEAVAVAHGSVIASHSNARAIKAHPRNLTDAQIYAIGATGGLIGVNFFPAFVDGRAEAGIIRQIDYIAGLIGFDKVALGPDYVDYLPRIEQLDPKEALLDAPLRREDLASVADLPRLAAGLLASGHSAERVRDVMGGNALRFLKRVLT